MGTSRYISAYGSKTGQVSSSDLADGAEDVAKPKEAPLNLIQPWWVMWKPMAKIHLHTKKIHHRQPGLQINHLIVGQTGHIPA